MITDALPVVWSRWLCLCTQVENKFRPVKILGLRASGGIARSLLTLGASATASILRLAKAI
jgi:hypothetical protein